MRAAKLTNGCAHLLLSRSPPKLDRMLERSVAQANSYFMDHKLMLGVINVGGLATRSRFVVPLVFFDANQCIVSRLGQVRGEDNGRRQHH